MWIVAAKCLEMTAGTSMSLVCDRNRSGRRVTGKLFHRMDAATGNERRPMVARDIPEPAAGVMRMSADDDDQADQQHEPADPCMTETDHSVLETVV